MIRITPALAAALALSMPAAAAAQDYTLSAGVAIATDYMVDSVSQTDNRPALQAYVEGDYMGFYAGVWASNVRFGPPDNDRIEVDLYLGYRGEVGQVSFDTGYMRYFYDESGNCCGELFLSLGLALTDQLSLGSDLYFDPSESRGRGSVNASFSITDALSVSGAIGYNDYDNFAHGNVGVSYQMSPSTSLDLRYYDLESDSGRFVAMLSTDFTLLSR